MGSLLSENAVNQASPRIPAQRGAAQSQLALPLPPGPDGASTSPHVTPAASSHRATAPTPGPPRRHQLAAAVRQPDRARDRVSPAPEDPAARRARQFPAPQLPLDYIPVTVYREQDASKRQPAAFPGNFAKVITRGGPHPS